MSQNLKMRSQSLSTQKWRKSGTFCCPENTLCASSSQARGSHPQSQWHFSNCQMHFWHCHESRSTASRTFLTFWSENGWYRKWMLIIQVQGYDHSLKMILWWIYISILCSLNILLSKLYNIVAVLNESDVSKGAISWSLSVGWWQMTMHWKLMVMMAMQGWKGSWK